MKNNNEIVSKICNKKRYEKILIDLAKENRKNDLRKTLSEISKTLNFSKMKKMKYTMDYLLILTI